MAEEKYHPGGKNRSSYTLYKVVLKHRADEVRDVLLYCSRSDSKHRHETEPFATMLQRPVLVDEGEGRYVERTVQDLDKSIAELVDEGEIDARFNPYDQPQGGKLVLQGQADGELFSHHYRSVGSIVTC